MFHSYILISPYHATTNQPQNGPLAVPSALSIIPTLNNLLRYPFTAKIATQDWHPQTHISFASNHSAPCNIPFDSETTIANPLNPAEKITTRLWPDHCVQNTPGANLHPELDVSLFDEIVRKGSDQRVEMYSAFAAPFEDPVVAESELDGLLRAKGVTDVFVVGLALDYCVFHTACDAAKRGYRTWVVEDATRIISEDGREGVRDGFKASGVEVVALDGKEVRRVQDLK